MAACRAPLPPDVNQAVQECPGRHNHGAAFDDSPFFEWSYKNGNNMASELDYVPLPDSLVKQIAASWGNVKDASGKAVK